MKSPSPHPRAASWTQRRGDSLDAHLPALRATLEEERTFRRDQLARLDLRTAVDPPIDGHQHAAAALREVNELIAAGARRALDDIELALARIRTGRYGYCRTCGLAIPLVVLEAIPKTTLCLACQGQTGRRTDPAPSGTLTVLPRRR